MTLPVDSKELYFNWLLRGESYEETGWFYEVDRSAVYKRIRTFQTKLDAGCECPGKRCWCGRSPGRGTLAKDQV